MREIQIHGSYTLIQISIRCYNLEKCINSIVYYFRCFMQFLASFEVLRVF